MLTNGLVAISIAGLAAYHLPESPLVERLLVHGHPMGKEQWREVQAAVAARARAGARVVLYPAYLDIAFRYYDRGRHARTGVAEVPADVGALERAVPGLAEAPQVFWIFSHDKDEDRARFLSVIADETGEPAERIRSRLELFPRQWGIRLLESTPRAKDGPGPAPVVPARPAG